MTLLAEALTRIADDLDGHVREWAPLASEKDLGATRPSDHRA